MCPMWICDDCGGHFKEHHQEHLCPNDFEAEQKLRLKAHIVYLKSEILKTLEQAGNDELLDDYQEFVLEKMVEELEGWV